jgi:hypothetical protein
MQLQRLLCYSYTYGMTSKHSFFLIKHKLYIALGSPAPKEKFWVHMCLAQHLPSSFIHLDTEMRLKTME